MHKDMLYKQFFVFIIVALLAASLFAQAPKLTVVIVIDQFSAHYIPKLRPFLTGGIKMLDQEGVSYLNAFYDHSLPATGPGHTLLTTGTYGSVHGIINNRWYDAQGRTIHCDEDNRPQSFVFSPNGLHKHGRSAHNIMVDNLSDQLVMHSYPHARNTVWSLSLKSRAAISMAGRLGKPIWFDDKTGNYTSSKAYFKELPAWVKKFNKETKIDALKEVAWKPFYPEKSPAYAFKWIDDYSYSSDKSIIGKALSLESPSDFADKYDKTPLANQHLIDLAKACLATNLTSDKNDRFILWLSLSSLDKVGHIYGPNSKEAIDMVYHMDAQLKKFIDYVYTRVDKEDVLFVLTADHGIQPIVEQLKKEGLEIAHRYVAQDFIKDMNTLIEKKYGIPSIVQNFKEPQFYLNQQKLAKISYSIRGKIYEDLKNYLLTKKGIRRAWSFDELQKTTFADYDLDKYLQKQLYKGRSGQIIYAVSPYTAIDTYAKGTSHITQYACDTQVPLIFYQAGSIKNKKITNNVYMPQVSVTLATLLDVPRPSAATASVLPGLFQKGSPSREK